MAKVAAAGPLAQTSSIQFGGGGGGGGGGTTTTTTLKRKTPSELRGELLKRKNVTELVNESPFPVTASTRDGDGNVPLQKKDLPKYPNYIDARMNDLFPVRKNSISLRLLSKQGNAKENAPAELSSRLNTSSVPSHLVSDSQPKVSCKEDSVTSVAFCEDRTTKTCNTAEKCSDSTFRTVAELSLGGEDLSGMSNLDMDKALKGLVVNDPLTASASLAESSEITHNLKTQSSLLEYIIPGKKIPLDLTLKTTMRVVSSTSVNWFHRSVNCGTIYNKFHCGSWGGLSGRQDMTTSLELTSCTPGCNVGGISSWVFPQSPLPSSVISALTSAAVGGQVDFLTNRQKAWEDSFRSLYYMLRKNICNIFYVCTAQFVVMFIACDGPKETKRTCNAYISQSTRGLRSLLKEHDICFSMPLCHSKMDEVAAEDLVELSMLEKHKFDEAQHFIAMSDVDNGPQSLLMFTGNQSVHGLYDFLLNFRFFFLSLAGVDVPILYSPVPFENAALSAPQVRCKEVRRADQIHVPPKDSNGADEPTQGSSPGICYSVEVKDAYLPPWAVSSMCDALGSNGTSFEASFMTEPTSIGLNVGLESIGQDSQPQATKDEALQKVNWNFGIQNTSFSPHLRSTFLKCLKYNSGSYRASLSHVH
ncbi:hypothetical protein ACH5RR_004455 [Cinchona calisaya]|uniref:Donson n=1 Tax=Cinchona calisaya TaxID=153742 RepID=A0ABD3AXM6_9GENT